MVFMPTLLPLLPDGNEIYTEITYEKHFTTVDDSYHDDEHIHDFYEIYVNLSGDVSFLVEDRVYPIQRGDIILTAPNKIHRCIYHSDCVHEHFCIWIKGLSLDDNILETSFKNRSHIVLSDKDKELLIERCFALYQNHRAENGLRFRAAHSFFGIVDLVCTAEQVSASAKSLPVNFTDILLFISRHFHEPSCNIERLCDRFFISKSSLHRRFIKYFGTSPARYIESIRFAEAKKLLSIGHSVQYVCFHCGFSECSYFIMRFRKKFGVTPHQYKNGKLPILEIEEEAPEKL